jgi:hypothetical protein
MQPGTLVHEACVVPSQLASDTPLHDGGVQLHPCSWMHDPEFVRVVQENGTPLQSIAFES